MAIIYTYPTKAAAAADLVLISDSADENKTKNASISSIRDAIDVVDVISAGPGISVSNPTGNVTIGNTGVLSLIAGSNISLSGSTGNITISTSASNVDGSGTTDFIPKWTDSNTLGDSQIFQLGTDIGIGTTAPTEKLHVAGKIKITGAANFIDTTRDASSQANYIRFYDSSTSAVEAYVGFTSNNRDFKIDSANEDGTLTLKAGNFIGFTTNASEKMRIGSNGDVGIGTSFPFEKLQVAGKIRVDGTGANSLQLFRNSTIESNYIEFYDKFSLASEALVGYTHADGEFKIYNAKATSTEFFTSGLQRMVITGSGNIGIGTSSPPTKMAIADNAPILRFINTSGTNNSYYMNVGMFGGKATIDAFSNTNGSAPLYFSTGGSNRMQLSATGNLSIGPFPGTEKLNVDGTVDLTNLKVSGAQGNSGDVLTSSGTGVSWAPIPTSANNDSWFAGCASVGSSSNVATNPRQASFTFPNEAGSSNFGPCIISPADLNVINVSIKWNGSNAPVIGANGTVNFKLGKLTDPSGNPDTQEGTVNYTNIADLTGLQITSADSGTWINKGFGGMTASVTKGDVVVIIFPRPTTGWTGTGATNGDLQLTMFVEYT